MKRKIIILLAACVAAAPLQAQNLEFGGLTYNNDLMMSTDFAALSRSHPFGTARVMGMGGAFTSLGADLSSMSINRPGWACTAATSSRSHRCCRSPMAKRRARVVGGQ